MASILGYPGVWWGLRGSLIQEGLIQRVSKKGSQPKDWKVVDFVQLRTRVRAMPGTASAVAVVREAPYLESGVPTAVAVFREAYGASHEMPCTLMGRCGGPSAPPLLSLSSRELQHAGLIEPRILSELRTTGPSKKPVERTAPPWRDEYVSATKAEDLGLTEARGA